MKHSIISFFVLTALCAASVQAQTVEGSVAYFEEITSKTEGIKKESFQYLKAVIQGKSARKVDKRRRDLIEAIAEARAGVRFTGPFKYDQSLKEAMMTYLDMSHSVLNGDYTKILDMEEIAEQSYDLMEAYLLAKEQAGEKLSEAHELYQNAVSDFAAKNNIRLVEGEEDKTSEKIRQYNEVLGYYNDIYLIFFKSYKQEAYVVQATSDEDVAAIEQHNNALLSFAEEGTTQLAALPNFGTDRSLKVAADKMLAFYQRAAKNKVPASIAYYLAKEDFAQIKATVESKKKKDLTQQDVDRYNAGAQNLNALSQRLNVMIEATNEERAKLLDQWNKAVDNFFSNHSK